MSANFLNQNFDDDEEEDDDDFNPAPAVVSDEEGGSEDEQKPRGGEDMSEQEDKKEQAPRSRTKPREDSEERGSRPAARSNGRVKSEETDLEEDNLDEDNGEDDEGEGEDLGNDDEEEEEEEEEDDEDDEEAVSGRPRKRRKRALNQFFEEEAEVDDDDDDLEGDEDDEAEGFVADTHPDDLDQLPAGAENDDRRHRELDRRRDLEASMDAEKQAQALKERYGRRTATAMSGNSFVPQNLLMPSVDDPSIWGIRCKPGKEREVVFKIMKKFEERQNTRNPMRICSAFERGSGPMAGYIFVEAKKRVDVDDALANVADVYPRTKTNLVPVKEMPDLLRVTKSAELVQDGYVRIKRGLYQGDLAMIQEVESNGLEITVRLVPRLNYGMEEDDKAPADSDGKRKRMPPGAGSSIATRPPPRLFNEAEAKKRHSRFLTPARGLGGRSWNYKNDLYEDGFLIKDMKLQHLITQDVNPRLDEITKLTRTATDGTETLDLESLAHSLRNNTTEGSYVPGDEVEVYDGEQKGIIGRTEVVIGNIVSIKVSQGELEGQIVDVPMKGLRKKFNEGDHVKVIGGRYRDEVGMVIRIKDDRVTVLTDVGMQEITVFSKDLREATDTIATSTQTNQFEIHDLIQLDPSRVGCVIKLDRESLRVLDQDGTVSTRLPSQITQKIEVRKNAVATDKNGSEIRTGDVVRESGGEGKTGTILHIHRSYLFIHNRTQIENAGLWTTRCTNVVTTAAKGGRITAPSTDLTKMNPALVKPNGAAGMPPPPKSTGRDKLIGKHVSIRKGPYKSMKGRVKDTTETEARIELESKNKIVTLEKDSLMIIDTATNKSVDFRTFMGSRGLPGSMRTGFGGAPSSRVPDGGYGGRTPLPLGDGGRTPAWGAGSRTPAWSGAGDSGRTPVWKAGGSQTSYGGSGNMTAYGGAGNFAANAGGRTPTWTSSARTPYGGEHGFSTTTTNTNTFDTFASGSRTPAYGSAGASSRTPAWGGPGSNLASAPTPGRSYGDAPTPAASAPTPAAYGDDDPYTPYAGAPTPGGFSGPHDAPTPAFAKGANNEPLKQNRFEASHAARYGGNDVSTPAANAPTPYASGYDAPTPAATGGPRYIEDDDD